MRRIAPLLLASAFLPAPLGAAPTSDFKLQWKAPCAFAFTGQMPAPDSEDYKAAKEVNSLLPKSGGADSHVCDYLKTQHSQDAGDFNGAALKEQGSRLKQWSAEADKAYAAYQDHLQRVMASSDPALAEKKSASGAKASSEAREKRLRAMRDAVDNDQEAIASAQAFGGGKYLQPFSARIKEIDAKLGEASGETAQKNEAIKASMDKKLAQSEDNKSQTGRLKGSAQKLQKGDAQDQAKLSQQMFEGNSRKGGRLADDAPASRGAAQLQGAAVAGGTLRGGYTSYKGMQDADVKGLERPKGEAKAGGEESKDNWWVKRVKAQQAVIEDHGTEMMVQADKQSALADKKKAEHDAAASKAWSQGNYGSAAWEKAKGWGSYAYHTGAQVGYTGAAMRDAVQQGELDVARGDPVAVKKVAIGGAAIAAIATAGASIPVTASIGGMAVGGTAAAGTAVSGATVLGAGLSAGGAALTTHGIVSGSGKMARAENGKEFALGATEVGANVFAGQIAKGAGKAISKTAEVTGLSGPAEKFGAWAVTKGGAMAESLGVKRLVAVASEKLAGKAVAVAEESAVKGATQVAEHEATKVAAHSAEKSVVHVLSHEAEHHGVAHAIEAAAENNLGEHAGGQAHE